VPLAPAPPCATASVVRSACSPSRASCVAAGSQWCGPRVGTLTSHLVWCRVCIRPCSSSGPPVRLADDLLRSAQASETHNVLRRPYAYRRADTRRARGDAIGSPLQGPHHARCPPGQGARCSLCAASTANRSDRGMRHGSRRRLLAVLRRLRVQAARLAAPSAGSRRLTTASRPRVPTPPPVSPVRPTRSSHG
jgi:hypothetical protein